MGCMGYDVYGWKPRASDQPVSWRTAAPRGPESESVWAKVERAAAQAMSQWLLGLLWLRPSVKTHLAPVKVFRSAKKSAAMSGWFLGMRFSATESWFMRAKPRSCFFAPKL